MFDSDLVTFDHFTEPWPGSTPHETFRGTLTGRTPTGERATVIITRQGFGAASRVWVTFDGAIKTTVVLTDPETEKLRELCDEATARRGT